MRAKLISGLLVLISTCAPAAFGQATGAQGLHRVSWPGKAWSLDVSLAPLTVMLEESLQDNAGYEFVFTLGSSNQASGRLVIRKNDRRMTGLDWLDPLSDPEFESFRKNEKFRKAVKALKK